MPTILLEVSLIPEALALLDGFEVRGPEPRIAAPDVDLRGVNAIIISSLPLIDAAFLDRAPDLRVVGRPGIDTDLADLTATLPALAGKVHLAQLAELPYSSSEIRQRVADGQPIDELTVEPVVRYIQDHGLYLPQPAPA